MVAQQFEVCEFVGAISGAAIGAREPMLKVSTARNNRASRFIGLVYHLSGVSKGDSRSASERFGGIDFAKILCKDSEKLKV
jgi:hypothetical protein